jgi:tRNA G10  N-methylase Trm11
MQPEKLEHYLTSADFISEFFGNVSQRVHYGISLYQSGGKDQVMAEMRPQIYRLLRLIKDTLAEKGILSRFPNQAEDTLSSASVVKNKLLEQGAEVDLIVTQDRLLITKTVAVQEFEAFSERDYGRPVRDMQSGVMPPKLARMMLNLSQAKKDAEILDPFCGSGTMLQEAVYLGYKNITGSDASEKAIADTQKNIDWLANRETLEDVSITLAKADVTKLAEKFGNGVFNAIITEPYLGPNFKMMPLAQDVKKIQEQLMVLYVNAWKQFSSVLKSSGVVVMILPVHNVRNQYIPLPILDEITKLGFTQQTLSQNPRKSLQIGNKYDFVLREIVKFVKK